MLKQTVSILLIVLLSGCAVVPAETSHVDIHYTAPRGVIYISPHYPAPGVHWHWVYSPRVGWGWYHKHHGFHKHHRHGR